MLSESEIQRIADRVVEGIAKRSGETDQMLDVRQASHLLGCSIPSLERRTRDGSIPSVKIGRLRRYRRSDLLAIPGCPGRTE
jgi:excisionase family DNA binding protein